ncbi:LysE family translocator [Agrobacterium vitis]|uniref:LysE family translocator n=1 Tax=Allorhizobium ampelinum TaxID=3025782 RepID=UPI001F179C66|nr:LysE family translocator [Allorhizobium ampelinum]MCF1462084.1 LysE family translocator [Allorhizobium ampelinum]
MTNLWIYVGACLAIIAIPGPALIYILSRTVEGGFRAGFLSASGIAVGALANALASAVGLSLIFKTIPASLTVVKYLGAAYLLFLAYKAVSPGASSAPQIDSDQTKFFRQGVIVSLLNPKVTLFFAAFLPTFIDPSRVYFVQTSFLAVTFVIIAFLFDISLVLTSGYT